MKEILSESDRVREKSLKKLDEAWNRVQECAERLRQKTDEAQLIIRLMAEEAAIEQVPVARELWTLPSSEPSLYESQEPIERAPTISPEEYKVDMSVSSVHEIYDIWTRGALSQPSLRQMEAHFGEFAFARAADERRVLLLWRDIVKEIDFHVENGRDLDEVLAVAELCLNKAQGNIEVLASTIRDNLIASKRTFFEGSSSSVWE